MPKNRRKIVTPGYFIARLAQMGSSAINRAIWVKGTDGRQVKAIYIGRMFG